MNKRRIILKVVSVFVLLSISISAFPYTSFAILQIRPSIKNNDFDISILEKYDKFEYDETDNTWVYTDYCMKDYSNGGIVFALHISGNDKGVDLGVKLLLSLANLDETFKTCDISALQLIIGDSIYTFPNMYPIDIGSGTGSMVVIGENEKSLIEALSDTRGISITLETNEGTITEIISGDAYVPIKDYSKAMIDIDVWQYCINTNTLAQIEQQYPMIVAPNPNYVEPEPIDNIRQHDKNYDIIKFNNIAWLEERNQVEDNIMNLITNTSIKKTNEALYDLQLPVKTEEGEIYTSKYPDGYLVYNTHIADKNNDNEAIGKIAGWNTRCINIVYINNTNIDDTQYAFEYYIYLSEENNKIGYKAIYDDIKEKLMKKYSMCDMSETVNKDKNGDIWSYSLDIQDSNNNHVALDGYNSTKIVTLTYSCDDINQYMINRIKQHKKEEEEALAKELDEIKGNSDGL